MSHDRPTPSELAEATREFLEREILPLLDDHRLRFRTIVAINGLGILQRELESEDPGLDAGELVARIRAGDPPPLAELEAHVAAKLRVANPRYLDRYRTSLPESEDAMSQIETEHIEHDQVVELLRRDLRPEDYAAIRELWKKHSLAEDGRDLPGLISTLTGDCVYEIKGETHRWEGHEGAARFYAGLLGAFPDIHFDLTDIVIGPQGVCEEARVTGTFLSDWLDYPATGETLTWNVVIFFPWDQERRLFKGEKVYTDLALER